MSSGDDAMAFYVCIEATFHFTTNNRRHLDFDVSRLSIYSSLTTPPLLLTVFLARHLTPSQSWQAENDVNLDVATPGGLQTALSLLSLNHCGEHSHLSHMSVPINPPLCAHPIQVLVSIRSSTSTQHRVPRMQPQNRLSIHSRIPI